MDKRLDEGLEVPAGALLFPVEQVLPSQVPGWAIVKADEVGEGVKLHQRKQLRTLAVVPAHLVQGLGDAVELRCRLCLDHEHRHPVHEEGHVKADAIRSVVVGEFVGDMEGIRLPLTHFHQADVPLPLLLWYKDRLQSLQVLPGVEVALDAGRNALQAAEQVLRPVGVHGAGIQSLHALHKYVMQNQPALAAAQPQCFLRWQVCPSSFRSVADERVLNCSSLATECHGVSLLAPIIPLRVPKPRRASEAVRPEVPRTAARSSPGWRSPDRRRPRVGCRRRAGVIRRGRCS